MFSGFDHRTKYPRTSKIVALRGGYANRSNNENKTNESNLSPEMLKEVEKIWSLNEHSQVVFVNNFGISIKQKDLSTLKISQWLNCHVINFYMNLIIERGKLQKYSSVYAMNSYFYPKFRKDGFDSVAQWTKKVDIFEYDFLVVPIYSPGHWSLAVVDFHKKKIQYYDSMGYHNKGCLKSLLEYLQLEMLDKKWCPLSTKRWKLEFPEKIPQQLNASDCGVFCCQFAKFITAKKQISFTQKNMPNFRKEMVQEILHSKLLDIVEIFTID